MAFDRSARFLPTVVQTPPVVGPGTYDPPELFKTPTDPDGMYAFLSSAKRNTLTVNKDAICFPGPGAYDVKEFMKHIPGGCSIDFTDSRSKYHISDGPGPNDYVLPNTVFKQSSSKQRSHPVTWRGTAGSLYSGPPPRSMIASGVSVPTHRDVNGYDINKFGFLVKNPPDEYTSPLFYDVPREETNFTTIRYRGNFWSLMTGRTDDRISVAPGPADYDLEKRENPGKLQVEKLRESRRMNSKQTRYVEDFFRKKLREGVPAPNAYDVPKSPFDNKKVSCECHEYLFKPPPFGQAAKRFGVHLSDNPAPGTYDPINGTCYSRSVIGAPFGSLAGRFKACGTTPTPGPGQYYSPTASFAYENIKRCKKNYVNAAFNSSVKRMKTVTTSDGPGPDRYPLKMNWKIPRTSVYHSAFKSSTKRFNSHLVDTVAPNAYDVTTAYKACHEPCEFQKCPENAPFNSRKNRMPGVPNGIDMNVPGPGRTDLRGDISKNAKGGIIGYVERFPEATKETSPGPQDYCLHPYSASSILRKHFNVTLGKPATLKDLEPPEIPWVRRLRTKKNLRTFNKTALLNHEFCKSRRH